MRNIITRLEIFKNELVNITLANPTFNSNLNGWSIEWFNSTENADISWYHSNGCAFKSLIYDRPSFLYQNVITITGRYKVSYTLVDYTTYYKENNTINCRIRIANKYGVIRTQPGYYEEYFYIDNISDGKFGIAAYRGGCGLDNIKIELVKDDKYYPDLYKDIDISINFNLEDITTFRNNKTNFTNTFRIPGSRNNNIIFENIYSLSKSIISFDDFNLDRKLKCVVYQNDIIVFEGLFEMNKVIDNHSNIVYECIIYSNTLSFFDKIGSKLIIGNTNPLDDISFAEYNHTFNSYNIFNSWSNLTYGKGYTYPVIDYTAAWTDNIYDIINMRPALYHKELLDKIFEKNGFTYTSTFFNSNDFKKLMFPGQYDVLIDQTELDKRHSKMCRNFNNYPIFISVFSNQYTTDTTIDYNYIIEDQYNQLDINTEKFKAKFTGTYDITFTLETLTELPNPYPDGIDTESPNPYPVGGIFIDHRILGQVDNGDLILGFVSPRLKDSGALIAEDSPFGLFNITAWKIDQFGVTSQLSTGDDGWYLDEYKNERIIEYQSQYKNNTFVASLNNLKLLANETVFFKVKYWNLSEIYNYSFGGIYYGSNIGAANVTVIYGDNSTYMDIVAKQTEEFDEGNYMTMNSHLPTGVKQADYIGDIIKMFNLVIVEDINKKNNFIIEPYDTYFSDAYSATTINWTGKIDVDSDVEIERLREFKAKNLRFTYKLDSDHYNEQYNTTYKKTYGDRLLINPDTIKMEENKTELLFSPTVIASYSETAYTVPKIFKFKKVEDNQNTFNTIDNKFKHNMRILYLNDGLYNGIKPLSFRSKLISGGGIYNTRTTSDICLTLSHYDNNANPTLDLNFDKCDTYYTWNIGSTNNDLFNTYFKNKYLSYISEDARKVTASFNIIPTDIFDFKWNDIIRIDNIYYYVYKINEYNPFELTKIELIKIVNKADFIDNIKSPTTTNIIIKRNFDANPNTNITERASDYTNTYTINNVYNIVNNPDLNGSTIINGTLFRDGVYTPFDCVLDGGTDCVYNPFSIYAANCVDGGYNCVRLPGSFSPINVIKSL